MKKLIYGLFVFFGILIAFTIAKSAHVFDGLVQEHYYESGKGFFRAKEAEQAMGLEFTLPKDASVGANDIRVAVTAKGAPFKGAKAVLYVGSASSPRYDTRYEAVEQQAGIYGARVDIPQKGQWMMRLEFHAEGINTERVWFVQVP